MAARHTITQTVMYTAIQAFKRKHKKHSDDMTQITRPQTWQIHSKSVLWRSVWQFRR